MTGFLMLQVLAALRDFGPVTPSDVASQVNTSLTATYTTLDRLKRRGLVASRLYAQEKGKKGRKKILKFSITGKGRGELSRLASMAEAAIFKGEAAQ